MVSSVMEKVSIENMNGCIQWFDDTHTEIYKEFIRITGSNTDENSCSATVGFSPGNNRINLKMPRDDENECF